MLNNSNIQNPTQPLYKLFGKRNFYTLYSRRIKHILNFPIWTENTITLIAPTRSSIINVTMLTLAEHRALFYLSSLHFLPAKLRLLTVKCRKHMTSIKQGTIHTSVGLNRNNLLLASFYTTEFCGSDTKLTAYTVEIIENGDQKSRHVYIRRVIVLQRKQSKKRISLMYFSRLVKSGDSYAPLSDSKQNFIDAQKIFNQYNAWGIQIDDVFYTAKID